MTPFAPLAALFVWAAAGSPADLATVDRSIRKEPAYTSGAPRYALLVFGPKAATRVWVVLDGETLVVDADGDGDLTAPRERLACGKTLGTGPTAARLFGPVEVAGKPGQLLLMHRNLAGPGEAPRHFLRAWVGSREVQHGAAVMAAKPADAPVIAFGGAFAFELVTEKPLVRGTEVEIGARIVSPGLGEGMRPGERASTSLFVEPFAPPLGPPNLGGGHVPAGVHPVAEVTFPPALPGGTPVSLRVPLTRRC